MAGLDAAKLQSNPVSLARKPESAPPPKSNVSPLAMSNGVSGPTPFSEALQKARDAAVKKADTPAPTPAVKPDEPAKPKKQGTQMMVGAPKTPPKKIVPKTVAMDPAMRAAGKPVVPAAPSSRANAAPLSAAPGRMPQSVPPAALSQPQLPPQSVGVPNSMPRSFPSTPAQPVPQSNYGGGAYPYQQQQAPAPQAQQGWQPPPQQPYPNYAFGYAPGARVHVTWSNGQRYPATVTQVTGSQCLVVFPDGQQHWVDMQYLSPG